jgi:hypothetical protein
MVHKEKLATYHIVTKSMIEHFQYLIPNLEKKRNGKS